MVEISERQVITCYITKKGGYILAIMRLWHGKVAIEKADEYERFMIEKAAPDYGSVDGLLKLYFQRRNENKIAHFLLVTIWDSLESIKKFAGANPELAKYYPEDDNFLLEKETHTHLYEVFYEK
jgi:heme-degrading monooxygenase HmoA